MLYSAIFLIVLGGVFFYLDSQRVVIDECNYDSGNYVGKSADECSRVQVLCAEGFERFDDSCGCGCKSVEDYLEKTFCNEEDRLIEVCISLYDPVCGYNLSAEIVRTIGNSCEACTSSFNNADIEYWTEGECSF